jgi:hypothetical protein
VCCVCSSKATSSLPGLAIFSSRYAHRLEACSSREPDLETRLSAGLESEDEPVRQHPRLSFIPRVVPPVRLHEEYATRLLSVSLQCGLTPPFLRGSHLGFQRPHHPNSRLLSARGGARRGGHRVLSLGCGGTSSRVSTNVDDDPLPLLLPPSNNW